jgi:hypothetical protein
MSIAAALVGILPRSKKKSGKPVATAAPKQIVCLLVSPNKNFERITVKSLGIETYAIFYVTEKIIVAGHIFPAVLLFLFALFLTCIKY